MRVLQEMNEMGAQVDEIHQNAREGLKAIGGKPEYPAVANNWLLRISTI